MLMRRPRQVQKPSRKNFMMDLAAAEAEDDEVEAEHEQVSGTASGCHLPPLLRAIRTSEMRKMKKKNWRMISKTY